MELITNAFRHFFTFFIFWSIFYIALLINNVSMHLKVQKLEMMDEEVYKEARQRLETSSDESSEYEDAISTLAVDEPPPLPSRKSPIEHIEQSKDIPQPSALSTHYNDSLKRWKSIFKKLNSFLLQDTQTHESSSYVSFKDTELYSSESMEIRDEIFEQNQDDFEKIDSFHSSYVNIELTLKEKESVIDPGNLPRSMLILPKIFLPPRNSGPGKSKVKHKRKRSFATVEPRTCQRRNIREEFIIDALIDGIFYATVKLFDI